MTAAQQHRYEVWASNLLFLAFVTNVVADFPLSRGYFAPQKNVLEYFTLYAINPLLLILYYYIRQGLRGAKTLFLALYAFALLLMLLLLLSALFPVSYHKSPLEAINFVVHHALQAGACVLLLLSLRAPGEPSLKS